MKISTLIPHYWLCSQTRISRIWRPSCFRLSPCRCRRPSRATTGAGRPDRSGADASRERGHLCATVSLSPATNRWEAACPLIPRVGLSRRYRRFSVARADRPDLGHQRGKRTLPFPWPPSYVQKGHTDERDRSGSQEDALVGASMRGRGPRIYRFIPQYPALLPQAAPAFRFLHR